MSEFASPGQIHDATYSLRVASADSDRSPARTPAQEADDAVATAKRNVATVRIAVEAVRQARAANDPKGWAAAKHSLDQRLAEAKCELVSARARASDASQESQRQLREAERAIIESEGSASELAEPPLGWAPVSREAALVALLAAPSDGARDGWAQKEAALKAEVDQMSPAECSVLTRRLTAQRAGDPIATALAPNVRITRSRFDALLEYLGGARKREAMKASHARHEGASEGLIPSKATSNAAGPAPTTNDALRRVLEDGASDVAAQLEGVFSLLDGSERRAMTARLENYRPGSGDEVAARFARLDDATRRRLLEALRNGVVSRNSTAMFGAPLWREHGDAKQAGEANAAATRHDEGSASRTIQPAPGASHAEQPRTLLIEYLTDFRAPLTVAIASQLAETAWPAPGPGLRWAQRGDAAFDNAGYGGLRGDLPFSSRLAQLVGASLEHGETMPALVSPGDLKGRFELYVTGRLLSAIGPRDEKKEKERAHEIDAWAPEFAEALAQLVERAAVASLHSRVGPRFAAAWARAGQRPSSDDVIASHPMDALVARALAARGIVVDDGVEPAKNAPTALRSVDVHWLGREYATFWNFVRATPSAATAEEVAAALWRDSAKSSMAFAVHKEGDLFRVDPDAARTLIAEQYPHAFVGTTDASARAQLEEPARRLLGMPQAATSEVLAGDQLVAMVGSAYGNAAAATRQFATPAKHGEGEPATVKRLIELDRTVGVVLDALDAQVTPFGVGGALGAAYSSRAERVAMWTDGNAAAWLPVLQFQITQLRMIATKVAPLIQQIRAIEPWRINERVPLLARLKTYVQAAAVSELRDQSNELIEGLDEQARGARLNELDGAQVELHSSTRDLIALNEHSAIGTSEADAGIGDERQQALLGTPAGASPYIASEAETAAGEVALRSRITAARDALVELQVAADHAFGSPQEFHRMCPDLMTPADFVSEVRDRLFAIERLWIQAQRDGTPVVQVDPRAPDDWGEWQGRAYGLAAARKAFARIAGDEDLRDFIHDVRDKVHHAELVTAVVHLAAAIAIVIVTSGIASSAGAMVAAAILDDAGEAITAAVTADGIAVTATAGQQLARFAVQAAAFTADIAVNASINAAVQLAQSGAPGDAGSALLENALMDVFSRGLLGPLRAAQTIANNEARALARLPGLADGESAALLASADFAGTPAMLDMVTGAATQWAAHRLVTTFRGSADASSSFAEMALMQGAAIAIGKFFHGRVSAWHEHRAALESSKRGQLPAAKALFTARDAFYADAARLATDPAPDPNAGAELQARNQALLEQERALLTGHTDTREPTRNDNLAPPNAAEQSVDARVTTGRQTESNPALRSPEQLERRGLEDSAQLGDVVRHPQRGDGDHEYQYNMMRPGPLTDREHPERSPAAGFFGGAYDEIRLDNELLLYRVGAFGEGVSRPPGRWYTDKPLASEAQFRIDTAVKPVWVKRDGTVGTTGGITFDKSPAQMSITIRVPSGAVIYKGPISGQGGVHVGGVDRIQYYVPDTRAVKVEVIAPFKPGGHRQGDPGSSEERADE